ncbi:Do family serine endopeptidase [Rhizobiaceae bacterium BDR2-2]|uniref:Probable periplasmic serine endoprotease DegP-like n=1 Tax=Ectorhizobium quercum TaxID=2965071 RepID=A0AAE3N360_9HYPH|nr:Do family serine endopeptidase [Ectorhizobium quercum]MCX8998445.1 Do family serine endopeptidase [Ectorhizobium quercum]
MLIRKNGSLSPKVILKSSAVAGLAAVMLATGLPAGVGFSHAEPVKVDAPQVASFANVVDAVSPAVVSVRVQSNVQAAADESGPSFGFGGRGFDSLPDDHPLKRFFREFGGPGLNNPDGRNAPRQRGRGPLRPVSQGSGFFISEDGYLVTNNHVVNDGAAFTVVLNDGTELDAKLVGKDSRTDLAVLKVDANRKFTYVQFADDTKVRVGDWVVAVGNPFGLGGTVTAGIISARGRDIGAGPYDDFIQVDAAVNRGNSGGPTFNLEGEVVGINTAIFSPGGSGGNVGIAFAIPATTAKDVVASLIKDGKIERGWLGVQIQPVTKDIADSLGLAEASGALVVSPTENSPGEKAGMKQGDIVTAINGDTVKDARDLARKVASYAPGAEVEVSVWRNGKSEALKVTLGDMPAETAAVDDGSGDQSQGQSQSQQEIAKLGVSVTPSPDGNGLDIVDVDPDSQAAARGIKAGEKISAINNQPVKSADEAVQVIENARKDGRGRALFQIESDQGSRFVAVPIDQG